MEDSVVWSDIYGNKGIDYQNLLEILENQNRSVSTCRNQFTSSTDGYVFEISDEAFVRRFLILGTIEGTYHASEKELKIQAANKLSEIIEKGSGLILLRELIKISLGNRAPKRKSIMFALAFCALYQVRDMMNKNVKASEVDKNKKSIIESNTNDSTKESIEYKKVDQSMDISYKKALQQLALYAIPEICRIATDLFMFVKYCKVISADTGMKVNSRGWGRVLRFAVSNWYLSQNPDQLMIQVTKYRYFEGSNHRHLLRLAHIRPYTTLSSNHKCWKYHTEYDAIFNHIIEESKNFCKRKEMLAESNMKRCKSDDKKLLAITDEQSSEMEEETKEIAKLTLAKTDDATSIEKSKEEEPSVETSKVLQFLQAFERLRELTENDVDEAVQLINKYDFVYEQVPKDLLNSKKIWEALLVKMPLTTMMTNLGKMTVVGLLGSTEEHCVYNQIVMNKLLDEKVLKEVQIQPITFLLTSATYSTGHECKGRMKWKPSDDIMNALEKAFYASIQYLKSTNKRYCLSFDISNSMNLPIYNNTLLCNQAAAACAMTFIRTESHVTTMAFSDCLIPLKLNREMNLNDIVESMRGITAGMTDCSLPIIWAKQEKLPFDVFIVYTSNEACYNCEQPFIALQEYRTALNIPDAKLIVISMIETEFGIWDSADSNMLEIYGLDSSVPILIREFISGSLS